METLAIERRTSSLNQKRSLFQISRGAAIGFGVWGPLTNCFSSRDTSTWTAGAIAPLRATVTAVVADRPLMSGGTADGVPAYRPTVWLLSVLENLVMPAGVLAASWSTTDAAWRPP